MKLIKEQNKPLSNEISDKEAEEAVIKILNGLAKIQIERVCLKLLKEF